MHLINTSDYSLAEFIDSSAAPSYAILSHCWSQDPSSPEVNYRKLITKSYDPSGYGWQKIRRCCSLAKSRGLDWAWIDTCCIDKTSSAELSEAINSMYAWYGQARECYVLLDDVHVADMSSQIDRLADRWTSNVDDDFRRAINALASSRWFRRGWTLQELLAPRIVLFYDSATEFIGSGTDLAPFIGTITRIPLDILTGRRGVQEASIAQRMSWASSRETTRLEDIAYSLLGLFDVNMPLLYGEGEKAFFRLQQEIMRHSDDQSIFAWGIHTRQTTYSGVLASSPQDFHDCENIIQRPLPSRIGRLQYMPAYTDTNLGMAMYHRNAHPGAVGRWFGYSKFNSYSKVKLLLNCCERHPMMTRHSGSDLDVYRLLESDLHLSYRAGLLVAKYNRLCRIQALSGQPQRVYAAFGAPRNGGHRLWTVDTQPGEEEDVAMMSPMNEVTPPISPRTAFLFKCGNVVVATLLFTAATLVIEWLPKSSIVIAALCIIVNNFAGTWVLYAFVLVGLCLSYWDSVYKS